MRDCSSGIARAVASAALAVTLALGCIAPGVAFGDVGTDTGTITITASAGNEDVQYYAYKLFTCDVEQKSGSATTYIATGVEWPSDAMKRAVEGAIKTYDRTYAGTTAQDAASYIMNTIKGTDGDTRVGANGFAENLVKSVIHETSSATLEAGVAFGDMPEGYYLIVSKSDTITDAKMGTAPIFTMLGNGQNLVITEKTSVPTITKTVAEDPAVDEQSSYADAQVGQPVTFTLTATVPDSINTFTQYFCKIEDKLATSYTAAGDGAVTVQVALGSTPTIYNVDPACFVSSYADGALSVEFNDLKTATASGETIPIDATARVVVSYKAALNESATVGAPGNTAPAATLTYANNPQDVGKTSASTSGQVTVYEYQLNLCKYDKDDLANDIKTPLSGAKFTIQATGADDSASMGLYVQEDGTLGAEPHEFVTSEAGSISVMGLDAGTYTIKETSAPNKYLRISNDLSLAITPSFWTASDEDLGGNAVGSLKSVSATLSGGNGDSNYTKVDAELTVNGVVTIQVPNAKNTVMPPFTGLLPFTNMADITLVLVTGTAILVISLVAIVRRRLKART